MLADVLRNDLAQGNEWLLGGRATANRKTRLAQAAHARRVETRRSASDARRAAEEIGASVWSVTDPDDLADLLDASLDEADAGRPAGKVSGALFAGDFQELPDFPSFVRAIQAKTSGNVIPDLLEGMRVVSVISTLFRKGGARQDASATGTSSDGDTWDNLDFYAMPVPMLESALAAIRSLTCLAALVDLCISNRRSPPVWLVSRVVRGWVDGNRSFLRLVAMFHDNEGVPDDLLPKAHRLEQARLIEEHNQGEVIFEQFVADSRAHQYQ